MLRVIAEFEQYRALPAIVDECDAGRPGALRRLRQRQLRVPEHRVLPGLPGQAVQEDPRPQRARDGAGSSRPPPGASTSRASASSRAPGPSSPPAASRSRCSTPTGCWPGSARAGWRRRSDARPRSPQLDSANGRSMPEEVDVLASTATTAPSPSWSGGTPTTSTRPRTDAGGVELRSTGLDAAALHAAALPDRRRPQQLPHRLAGPGSPQDPTDEQLAAIKARQGLEELEPSRSVTPTDDGLAAGHPAAAVGLAARAGTELSRPLDRGHAPQRRHHPPARARRVPGPRRRGPARGRARARARLPPHRHRGGLQQRVRGRGGVKASGLPRDEVFVTTKLRNGEQGYESACRPTTTAAPGSAWTRSTST